MRKPMVIALMIVFFLLIVGCTNQKSTFNYSGKITNIDSESEIIYVNELPLYYKDFTSLKIGDEIELVIEKKTSEDDWDPKDLNIIRIVNNN
jgi:hypothetical protein